MKKVEFEGGTFEYELIKNPQKLRNGEVGWSPPSNPIPGQAYWKESWPEGWCRNCGNRVLERSDDVGHRDYFKWCPTPDCENHKGMSVYDQESNPLWENGHLVYDKKWPYGGSRYALEDDDV
jgi:hypothetical protein